LFNIDFSHSLNTFLSSYSVNLRAEKKIGIPAGGWKIVSGEFFKNKNLFNSTFLSIKIP
jgi:hypothetical protein